jgi:hypothetical protein
MFCTGFFKPFVGIGFSLFIFAVCNSELIAINEFKLSDLQGHAYYAIGFLSGFSERLAGDIITRAENRFVVLNPAASLVGQSPSPSDVRRHASRNAELD